ncbi:50S ribosomal protein L11 methyltransferase [uncultured Tyzzerella sp.]|uniref:50S ribosomal protein L11 methyltransferase n=1 Tax=uncultured Tyzzerella sp. TaxID=2321398 RepID=UPI002943C1EA|nr:50S ribosomal protein L11 methyltransferase [uncultured Tyzzerella sp.]
MEWIEAKIYTTREGIEPVSAVLLETGITGIQVEDYDELKEYLAESSMYWDYVDEELLNKEKEETKLKIYVSDNPYGNEILLNVKEAIKRLKTMENEIGLDLGRLDIETTANLNDEDWLNKWKEFYKPFTLGEKILIKPVWEEIENIENRVVFNINPGHVFGTGLHQTTQLCITNLEKYVNKESVVLDLGCGSGILSIISLLLGAKNAFAVDIDQNAVKVAYDNAELNGIGKDKYYVTSGNVVTDEDLKDEIGHKKYDIVLANIIADVICLISPVVPNQLKDDGVFIASGIIKDRLEDVYRALNENGLEPIDTITKDEWVCVVSKIKK